MIRKFNCPFLVHGDWCDDFDGPCAVVNGDRCEEYEQIRKRDVKISELEAQATKIAGLKAENKRLRKALEEIAKFANNECEKRGLAPSCVEFMTISRYAEKALKGAGK